MLQDRFERAIGFVARRRRLERNALVVARERIVADRIVERPGNVVGFVRAVGVEIGVPRVIPHRISDALLRDREDLAVARVHAFVNAAERHPVMFDRDHLRVLALGLYSGQRFARIGDRFGEVLAELSELAIRERRLVVGSGHRGNRPDMTRHLERHRLGLRRRRLGRRRAADARDFVAWPRRRRHQRRTRMRMRRGRAGAVFVGRTRGCSRAVLDSNDQRVRRRRLLQTGQHGWVGRDPREHAREEAPQSAAGDVDEQREHEREPEKLSCSPARPQHGHEVPAVFAQERRRP